jgi:fluoride exporter
VPDVRRELLVVSVGGGLGALARYGVGLLLPTGTGRFPWGTFGINVLGCLLIGMLLASTMVARHRLARPLLAVGVLGGFTTFSTYAVESHELLVNAPFTAFVYIVGTLVAAIAATAAGVWLVRRV